MSCKDRMRRRFISAWSDIGAITDPAIEFNRLDKFYCERHRYYHNWGHIDHCLEEFDVGKSLFHRPDLARIALFYHDGVYHVGPMAGDNEKRSAALAVDAILRAGLTSADCSEVKMLIIATKHDAIPQRNDAKFVVDIDLAIFGQPRELFDQYESAIRKEYIFLPPEIYCKRRIEVLKSFNERRTIYRTDFFRERYEEKAHENLKWSIGHLMHWGEWP